MKQIVLAISLAGLVACAGLQNYAPTVLDAAELLCQVFATESPKEFAAHVEVAMAEGDREKLGIEAAELCKLTPIVAPFLESSKSGLGERRAALGQ